MFLFTFPDSLSFLKYRVNPFLIWNSLIYSFINIISDNFLHFFGSKNLNYVSKLKASFNTIINKKSTFVYLITQFLLLQKLKRLLFFLKR